MNQTVLGRLIHPLVVAAARRDWLIQSELILLVVINTLLFDLQGQDLDSNQAHTEGEEDVQEF